LLIDFSSIFMFAKNQVAKKLESLVHNIKQVAFILYMTEY